MQIKFDANKKRLDTTPAFGLLVQGENLAESIQITGPKMVGALDLSQLRVAMRMTSQQYETTVEKTLEQTTDGDTITFTWQVDKQFTGSPGKVDVMLVGYGGNEEVIKITSSGMVVQEDRTFDTAPPESTWEQILQQMQDFATQAYESKTAAANSATEAAASQKVAEEKAAQATNAASEAVKAAETAAADAAAQAAAKTEQQIRQYADDRYARALQGTADPAASITIYPDAGSNVVVTAHGFTIQEGEGDPEPPTVVDGVVSGGNVRDIVNGGQRFITVTITGDETIVRNPTSDKQSYFYQIQLSNLSEVGPFIPMTSGSGWHLKSVSNKFPAGNPYSDAKKDLICSGKQDINNFNEIRIGFENDPGSVEAVKALFKSYVGTGDPLIIWCPLESGDGDLYAPLGVTGKEYTGRCLDLTKPLCDGDKYVTKAWIGCDATAVFDGSSDESWAAAGTSVSGKTRWALKNSSTIVPNLLAPTSTNEVAALYSDQYTPATAGYTYNAQDGISVDTGGQIIIYDRECTESLDEWKAKLAARPVKVRYKTKSYTTKTDKPVSLEIHAKERFTLDGKAEWVWQQASTTQYYRGSLRAPELKNSGAGSGLLCNMAKAAFTGEPNTAQASAGHILLNLGGYNGADDFESFKGCLNAVPAVIVADLSEPMFFVHDPVDLIANPGEDGTWVITGEANGKVSAVFNKNITHTIAELQAALLAVSAKLSL